MQNKIIVTVGLKGGGGKSTVCANLAMHLVDKGIPVIVYDADIQQTLVRHRQRELAEHPDAELPYQLLPFSTANADEVKSNMQKLKEVPAVILIDCPGNINDACLQHIYAAADLAVVPTRYDFDNLDTTILLQICSFRLARLRCCSFLTASARLSCDAQRFRMLATKQKTFLKFMAILHLVSSNALL